MNPTKRFSVVINTLDRATSLAATLAGLRQVRYDAGFEVIVVNGPSKDGTAELLRRWEGQVRIGHCPVPNLSMSRNVGIDLASGDYIAFIDDDAVPEPEWLTQLAAGYDCDDVGAVGGAVFDQTGHAMQYVYSTANRLGNADWRTARATPEYCFPCSYSFPYLQGTNTSFRRDVLARIGGFDEEIEFYLDETEVCCRMVDEGYLIRQLANAFVHHKFAPSHIRDTNRITRHRYAIIKNKLYFSLKHGRRFHSVSEILEDNQKFIAGHRADVEFHVQGGGLPAEARTHFDTDVERAWLRGLERGLPEPATAPSRALADLDAFLPFPGNRTRDALTVVLVTKDFPPTHSGGIARFNHDLAIGLVQGGHDVHVVTESRDIDRVDLEHGVWVHRVVVDPAAAKRWQGAVTAPPHLLAWSASARREVEILAERRRIDVIETPLWDCEGNAFLVEPRWPVVVSLQTSLHAWLDNHAEMRDDPVWMRSFGEPVLALERRVMQQADAIRAISHAILADLERAYDVQIDAKAQVQALGLTDLDDPPRTRDATGDVTILFVGRLEKRKGLDALLEAIPIVLARCSAARAVLVGDDALVNENGTTYRTAFEERHAGAAWFDRVRFAGKVEERALNDAYRDADVLVAPSRYESFGLIFVEAMRAGLPSIGCNAGGVPEVVADGETGLLVPIDAPAELADALIRLVEDGDLRLRLGEQGRARYLARFTATRMANDSVQLYRSAIARAATPPGPKP